MISITFGADTATELQEEKDLLLLRAAQFPEVLSFVGCDAR